MSSSGWDDNGDLDLTQTQRKGKGKRLATAKKTESFDW